MTDFNIWDREAAETGLRNVQVAMLQTVAGFVEGDYVHRLERAVGNLPDSVAAGLARRTAEQLNEAVATLRRVEENVGAILDGLRSEAVRMRAP